MKQKTIHAYLKDFDLINRQTEEKLSYYLQLVLEANKQTNLTSITDWEEAVIKHLYDSLALIKASWWEPFPSVLDLGSGAGFPGIPLAIACPRSIFYLVEANKKKANFLKTAKEKLQLKNIQVVAERSEILAHQQEYRGRFDLVLARAVAEISTLLELASPFCKIRGHFAALKGPLFQEELEKARKAMQILAVEHLHNYHYQLPLEYGERTVVLFKKQEATPQKYPRRPGIPSKRPL